MPGNTELNPRKVSLGEALKALREAAGLSQKKVAELAGTDPANISRWERGQRTPDVEMVATLLAIFNVTGDQREEILELARGADGPLWVAVKLPAWRQLTTAILRYESTAATIINVTPSLVSGLLQIPKYIRAIMSHPGVPADEVETRIAIRLGRQDCYKRADNPAQLQVFMGEAALRQKVGGRETLRAQLQHLLDMAEIPNVEIRIMPLETDWHPALDGGFTIYEGGEGDAVMSEIRRGGIFFHEPDDLAWYRQAVGEVAQIAMNPTESVEFIATLIKEMETGAKA